MSFQTGLSVRRGRFVSTTVDAAAGKAERTVAGFAQDPVPKVWPYFMHPQLVDVVVVGNLYMLRENAVFVLRQSLLRLTWRAMNCRVGILDFDNISGYSKVCTTAFPAIGTSNQWGQWCHIFLWLSWVGHI